MYSTQFFVLSLLVLVLALVGTGWAQQASSSFIRAIRIQNAPNATALDVAYRVISDRAGNQYISAAINLDLLNSTSATLRLFPSNTTLTIPRSNPSLNTPAMLIYKTNAAGDRVLWSRLYDTGAASLLQFIELVLSPDESKLFVAGDYSEFIHFTNPSTFVNNTDAESDQLIVFRLDAMTGNLDWAYSPTTNSSRTNSTSLMAGFDINYGCDGSVFITGPISGEINFGGDVGTRFATQNDTTQLSFVLRLRASDGRAQQVLISRAESNGNALWPDCTNGLFYVFGSLFGNASNGIFGPVTGQHSVGCYLEQWRLDTSTDMIGPTLRALTIGNANCAAFDLEISRNGQNILVVGGYADGLLNATLSNGQNKIVPNLGRGDGFFGIASMPLTSTVSSSDRSFFRVMQTWNTPGRELGMDVLLDPRDQDIAIISGRFGGNTTLGGLPLVQVGGDTDAFVAIFDIRAQNQNLTSGNITAVFTRTWGSTNYDDADGVAIIGTGSMLGGSVYSLAVAGTSFGPVLQLGSNLSIPTDADGYQAQLQVTCPSGFTNAPMCDRPSMA